MAMSMGSSGGVKSEINVTPLVDVMLVLLIIMMIVAPMLQKGVDVRLPVAANSGDKPETQEQTLLEIKYDKTLWVNGIQVRETELRTKIEEALESKKEKVILIKADEDVEYGAVMGAMDELRQGGIEDMGLITERKVKPGEAGGK